MIRRGSLRKHSRVPKLGEVAAVPQQPKAWAPCGTCQGKAEEWESAYLEKCPQCFGHGTIEVDFSTYQAALARRDEINERLVQEAPFVPDPNHPFVREAMAASAYTAHICANCDGSGKHHTVKGRRKRVPHCVVCKGSGRLLLANNPRGGPPMEALLCACPDCYFRRPPRQDVCPRCQGQRWLAISPSNPAIYAPTHPQAIEPDEPTFWQALIRRIIEVILDPRF